MLYKIDFTFLRKEEGRVRIGYVPTDKNGVIGKSGVTVASGVDLGQRTPEQIKALDLSTELKNKLIPYAAKRMGEATKYLAQNPLVLTWEEIDELDCSIIGKDIGFTVAIYDKDSKVKFDSIPWQAQTVLASLCWNFGPNLRRLPTTWNLAVTQQWGELAKLLDNFPGKQAQLTKRRQREAALLKTI